MANFIFGSKFLDEFEIFVAQIKMYVSTMLVTQTCADLSANMVLVDTSILTMCGHIETFSKVF